MYERHWHLSGRPFENWCDSRFFFPAEIHQTAMLKLRYGVENRRGALTLCGDSGMGKSMLVDTLVQQLPEEITPITRMVFPRLTGDQLLGYLAEELTGEAADPQQTPLQALRQIERCLNENIAAGQHALVVVDEAHLLTNPDQLETLRLLLNIRGGTSTAEAAWTLLLVGDSTLLGLIERNHALDQRMSVKSLLGRFTLDQTIDYIGHRLQLVAGDVSHIFTNPALEALHMRAGGIPRRINRLGDLALMVGYAEDLSVIDAPQIEAVHQELVSVAA